MTTSQQMDDTVIAYDASDQEVVVADQNALVNASIIAGHRRLDTVIAHLIHNLVANGGTFASLNER